MPRNVDPVYESPAMAATAGTDPRYVRIIAAETNELFAVVLTRENDDENPLHGLTVCEHQGGGWVIVAQEGGFDGEASLWMALADQQSTDEGSDVGVGVYCKRVGEEVVEATIKNGDSTWWKSVSGRWVLLLEQSIPEDDWHPHLASPAE